MEKPDSDWTQFAGFIAEATMGVTNDVEYDAPFENGEIETRWS